MIGDAETHGDERALDELKDSGALAQHAVPQDQDAERDDGHERCVRVDVLEGAQDFREGVLAVRLDEGQVAFRIGIPSQGVRNLFEDDQEADARQHPFNHSGRKEVGEHAGAGGAECDLHEARKDDRDEEGFEASESIDRAGDDHGEAGGGARHAERRTAQGADQDATDDAGDESCEQGGATGERDPETQRNGDEENHNAGGKIVSKMSQGVQVVCSFDGNGGQVERIGTFEAPCWRHFVWVGQNMKQSG